MSDIRVYDSFSTHSPAHASILPDLSCTASPSTHAVFSTFSLHCSCCQNGDAGNAVVVGLVIVMMMSVQGWMTKEVSEAGRMLFMTEVLCYSFFILHVVFKT